jgi:hypothetical protein
MVCDDTARRSESSWSPALHIVPKDNGWLLCGDCRALTARTIPDRYPVRHSHDHSRQLWLLFLVRALTSLSQCNSVHVLNSLRGSLSLPIYFTLHVKD